MNHGPAFQKLWTQLRREVKALQDKGYYGDGYWSSGTRLSDSAPIGGQGVADLELPEYVVSCGITNRSFADFILKCGGAQLRARPKSLNADVNIRRPSLVLVRNEGNQNRALASELKASSRARVKL